MERGSVTRSGPGLAEGLRPPRLRLGLRREA